MTAQLAKAFLLLAVTAASVLPAAAVAQSIGYGDSPGSGEAAASGKSNDGARHSRGNSGKRVEIRPYIEAAQIVTADLTPGNEVLTYTSLAAGVDANVQGRHNAGSVSLRYEHDFGWGSADDGDQLTGIARGYTTLAPGVQFDAGALAVRSSVQGNGTTVPDIFGDRDAVTHIYSVYAGPTVATHAGDIAIDADYRFGYTKLDEPDSGFTVPGTPSTDLFDDSTTHSADIHAGVKPYDVLPVGLGAGTGYYREDISNLDQRIEDFHARADVTVPVTQSLALVGGLGYEDVEISSRDAVRDGSGNPIIGSDGRYVTDKSTPRVLAYDTSGLIWDVGVIWRPSRRTALEAHFGRRYGSTSFYGSLAYAPTRRSSINVSVYDNLAGFGGQINRSLVALPTNFESIRNPITGDLGSCVSSLDGGNCLTGNLGSVRSATFRARGVMATYGLDLGRIQTGIGAGYDHRRFIAAPGTVLALADGVVDERYWLEGYFNTRLGRQAGLRTNVYVNWYQAGAGFGGDTTALGATTAYYRNLTNRLTATAALGINGFNQDAPLPDFWTASALLGVTYNF